VAVDATPIIAGTTGVARYARQLLDALGEAGVELVPFAIGRSSRPIPADLVHCPIPLRVVQRLWAATGRPRAEQLLKGRRADLVHSLDLAPAPTRLPLVMTVHDLCAIEHPDLHPAVSVEQQRRQLADIHRASAVLAVSRATADALVRRGVPAGLVEVVGLGFSPLGAPVPVDGVAAPFIFAVGTLHPRKGYDVLVRAAAWCPDVPIVIAGPDAGAGPALTALAESLGLGSLGLGSRIRWLGPVSDGQLAWLYQHATVLAFPSRAEGFGLPVLEAMAAGLPVVATDLPVLRELGGDAVRFVPVSDPEALGRALAELTGDDGARSEQRRAGLVRASAYSWAATAAATAACYQRVARRARRGAG